MVADFGCQCRIVHVALCAARASVVALRLPLRSYRCLPDLRTLYDFARLRVSLLLIVRRCLRSADLPLRLRCHTTLPFVHCLNYYLCSRLRAAPIAFCRHRLLRSLGLDYSTRSRLRALRYFFAFVDLPRCHVRHVALPVFVFTHIAVTPFPVYARSTCC